MNRVCVAAIGLCLLALALDAVGADNTPAVGTGAKPASLEPTVIEPIPAKHSSPRPVHCESLETCMALMASSHPKGSGWPNEMDERDQLLAIKLQSFGAAAIPGLLELMQASEPHVRERAAYTLYDIKGLTPADLPALEKATLAGVGFAPGAIKNIDTPESIHFLIQQLRADPDARQNMVGSALISLAPDSVPYLLDEYHCDWPKCPGTIQVIGQIFQVMGPKATSAVGPLAEIAGDTARSLQVRLAALSALRDMGPMAASAAPIVKKVSQEQDSELRERAKQALAAISEKRHR